MKAAKNAKTRLEKEGKHLVKFFALGEKGDKTYTVTWDD